MGQGCYLGRAQQIWCSSMVRSISSRCGMDDDLAHQIFVHPRTTILEPCGFPSSRSCFRFSMLWDPERIVISSFSFTRKAGECLSSSVYTDMSMGNQLARMRTAVAHAQTVITLSKRRSNNINRFSPVTPLHAASLLEVPAELSFQYAIGTARFWLLAQLNAILALFLRLTPCCPGAGGAFYNRTFRSKTTIPFKEELCAFRRHCRQTESVYLAIFLLSPPYLRRGGVSADGIHCAEWGVVSLIINLRPTAGSERIAASRRRNPVPLHTSTVRQAMFFCSFRPFLRCGLRGKRRALFTRLPRNPAAGASQEIALPPMSVMVTMVLLKEE